MKVCSSYKNNLLSNILYDGSLWFCYKLATIDETHCFMALLHTFIFTHKFLLVFLRYFMSLEFFYSNFMVEIKAVQLGLFVNCVQYGNDSILIKLVILKSSILQSQKILLLLIIQDLSKFIFPTYSMQKLFQKSILQAFHKIVPLFGPIDNHETHKKWRDLSMILLNRL